MSETCQLYKPVNTNDLNLNDKLPTVVLVGGTQAGKSFFGNMLLGVKNPKHCYIDKESGHTLDKVPKDCKFISGKINQKICM